MQRFGIFTAAYDKHFKKGGDNAVGKRINEKFLTQYMEADRICCMKFGIAVGGVTEYINRLNNARFAPGRDDILPRLVRYRNVRNRFAHEVGAIRRVDEISKFDIRWFKNFNKDLARKRDPISIYLRRARRYARHKKLRRILYAVAFGIIAVLAIVLYFALQKG
jgi:hypothetical protein